MMLTTQQLYKSGRDISYCRVGQGEPVVLLHGVGMQAAAWWPQIEALANTHDVIALNLPGHGTSHRLQAEASLTDYVAWLDEVLETLALRPVNLAGHSMGALIAAGYAASHPETVLRVALLNGVFCRSEEARAAVIARADQMQKGTFDLETPLKRWFGGSASEQAVQQQVRHWLSDVDLQGYATAYAAFARGDSTYAQDIDLIECPFLALTGGDDPNSTPGMSEQMAGRVVQGRAVVVPEHRHMVNLTAPEVVNAELRHWLGAAVLERTGT